MLSLGDKEVTRISSHSQLTISFPSLLETCVSYQNPGESNMAVVEVEMVSGFIPNKGSLKTLKENSELGM